MTTLSIPLWALGARLTWHRSSSGTNATFTSSGHTAAGYHLTWFANKKYKKTKVFLKRGNEIDEIQQASHSHRLFAASFFYGCFPVLCFVAIYHQLLFTLSSYILLCSSFRTAIGCRICWNFKDCSWSNSPRYKIERQVNLVTGNLSPPHHTSI